MVCSKSGIFTWMLLVLVPKVADSQFAKHSSRPAVQLSPESKPNFVIFFADDLGFADVGFNSRNARSASQQQSFTPHLNALAHNGVRLTDFHSAASTCSPSRASLLTGRLGLRNGVVENFLPASIGGLPLEEITLPQLLKEANYSTGMIGKWHLGLVDSYHPNSRGFSYYFGVPYSLDMGCADDPGFNKPVDEPCDLNATFESILQQHGVKHHEEISPFHDLALPLMENRKVVQQPADLSQIGRLYAEKATEFIKRSSAPLFLYVAFSHVHVPLDVDGKFKNASRTGPFQDTLMEMDDTVGKVVDALKEKGIFDDTVIWFASDNGPWEVKCDLAGSASPFKAKWQRTKGGGGSGSKQTVWEGGHRVPGFIHYPKVKPGTFDGITSTLDIFPTVMAMANLQLPSDRHFDGLNLLPLLNGASSDEQLRALYSRVIFHPNSGAAGKIGDMGAVRFAKNKAVFYSGGPSPDCTGKTGPAQYHKTPLLFNVIADPAESTPLPDPSGKLARAACSYLEDFLADIRKDKTHRANYATDPNRVPCCNRDILNCRCRKDDDLL